MKMYAWLMCSIYSYFTFIFQLEHYIMNVERFLYSKLRYQRDKILISVS